MTLFKNLQQLQMAYPEHIQSVSPTEISWHDGTKMPIGALSSPLRQLDNPTLADQLMQAEYPIGQLPDHTLQHLTKDPGRIRYSPFFSKMYGDTAATVEQQLTTIDWLSDLFSNKYPLKVTTINDVDKKLLAISKELTQLPTAFHKFVSDPPDTFFWRTIAGTQRLSPHSFGIAIDINVDHSHYWQWDLQKAGKIVAEDTPLTYQNQIPWEIVLIFEKYGFIWGGKWHHYDTMHFEYRPEFFYK